MSKVISRSSLSYYYAGKEHQYRCLNIFAILDWAFYHLTTFFYFTKSDIKTTIIPVTVFAIFAAPVAGLSNLIQSIVWTWLHLFQFDVSNQVIGIEEDKLNKPDRPIASGRITPEAAWRLRVALVPICIAYSAILYSTPVALTSVGIALLTIAYDEMGLHAGHWMMRNLSIALDYGLFELGATYVMSNNRKEVDSSAVYAVLLDVFILATTYHVQDFKDHDGDKKIGRQTFPIVMPILSRWSILIALPFWSVVASQLWELTLLEASVVCALGTFVGVRFFLYRKRRADQISFYWYNLWLTTVNCLVGIYRFKSQFQEA